MTHRLPTITRYFAGVALALLGALATASPARAAEGARVEVIVMELQKAETRQIDPALEQETQILELLPQYNRVRLIERRDTRLDVGENTKLEFATPAGKKAELNVTLLERAEASMKLRVRCAALQNLDTTTTHKEGGTFLVVRPQSGVGVAIRRVTKKSE